jgi:hypothetical protein
MKYTIMLIKQPYYLLLVTVLVTYILYVLPYTQGFFSRARHESLDECACRKIRQRVTEMEKDEWNTDFYEDE